MNYLLAIVFALVGVALLLWNKPLSQKLGSFYSRRFSSTFGTLAHVLKLDDPTRLFNRVLYRSFVIVAGLIVLTFAFAGLMGTNFAGPSSPPNPVPVTQ